MSVTVDVNVIEHYSAIQHALTTMAVSGKCRMDPHKIYDRTDDQRLADDVRNHCATIAVGKYLNRPYRFRLNTFHTLPVFDNPDMDVRTIVNSTDRLIVRKVDVLERWFVLVQGNPPIVVNGDPVMMQIIGCIRGVEAQRSEWIRDPNGNHRPAWFVPQSALWPAEVIPWL